MAEQSNRGSRPKHEGPTTLQKLEQYISKKIKLQCDPNDPVAMRKVALRALKLQRGELRQLVDQREKEAELEENNRKINDLELIEQQYTTYFQNLTQKNRVISVKSQEKAFKKYVSKFKLKDRTRELVELKAKTPFRINIGDFENKKLNVSKYYEMIQTHENNYRSEDSFGMGKSYNDRQDTDGNTISMDDLYRPSKFMTQPSLPELPSASVEDKKISLRQVVKQENSESKTAKEKSALLVLRDENKKSQNHLRGSRGDNDPYLTKQSSKTVYVPNGEEEKSVPRQSPRSKFMIKSSFRRVVKEDSSLMTTMRSRFENLTSLWEDKSTEPTRHTRKCPPQKCVKLEKLRSHRLMKADQTLRTHTDVSHSTPNRVTAKNLSKFTSTEGSDWSVFKHQKTQTSPRTSTKPKLRGSVPAEYELSEESIAALIAYTQQVRDQEADAFQKRSSINFKKQYKKLDTREKIDQEVKRMFEANFKGPGGKTATLLSSMLHHYIAFGSPAVSKMEVTLRVKEFMEKYRVKITPEEIKRLAAERHFYITTIQ